MAPHPWGPLSGLTGEVPHAGIHYWVAAKYRRRLRLLLELIPVLWGG
jgi:hypothetical protein